MQHGPGQWVGTFLPFTIQNDKLKIINQWNQNQ